MADRTPPGVELIAAERQRQVEAEGWTPEHDDKHDLGELASAAATYLRAAKIQRWDPSADLAGVVALAGTPWPWALRWWKPSDDPIRNLVKAGALIAAEIERLKRAEVSDG